MNATVKNDILGQPLLFLVCVSDFLKLRTSLRVTAALLGIRIFNEQLRRGLVSLIWVLLGFVCLFWLAVSLLLPPLRRRRGFAHEDLCVPMQLFSIYGE